MKFIALSKKILWGKVPFVFCHTTEEHRKQKRVIKNKIKPEETKSIWPWVEGRGFFHCNKIQEDFLTKFFEDFNLIDVFSLSRFNAIRYIIFTIKITMNYVHAVQNIRNAVKNGLVSVLGFCTVVSYFCGCILYSRFLLFLRANSIYVLDKTNFVIFEITK